MNASEVPRDVRVAIAQQFVNEVRARVKVEGTWNLTMGTVLDEWRSA